MTSLAAPPRPRTRPASYGACVSVVLTFAFALSATYTVYCYIAGTGDPRFTVTTPVARAFYTVGFAPRQQTTFGWFENDVYSGLLMVAAYLGVQRVRGLALVPSSRVHR